MRTREHFMPPSLLDSQLATLEPPTVDEAALLAGLQDGRIAAVEMEISPSEAKKTIDVTNLYVTPGLVDIHTHFFTQSAPGTIYDGESSVLPDTTCPRTCARSPVTKRNSPRPERRCVRSSRRWTANGPSCRQTKTASFLWRSIETNRPRRAAKPASG